MQRVASLVMVLTLALSPMLTAEHAHAKGKATRKAGPTNVMSQAEQDLSTALDQKLLPNGGMLWGLRRPGPGGAVALVVRAGSRNEDVGRSGVAASTAHWVLDGFDTAEALTAGVTTHLEMLPGGAVFVLVGPQAALPSHFARLMKAVMHPPAKGMALARDKALMEPRRWDLVRNLPDAVSAACWAGSSFELPTWGGPDLSAVEDGYERIFHRTWYLPRGMTVVAVGPSGLDPYAAAMAGASKARMARDTLAPGEPGLPIHQIQRQPLAVTLGGASLPGPADAGAALLLRGRLEELLDAAAAEGKLAGPYRADVLWTRKTALVYVSVHHPRPESVDEPVQEAQLKTVEGLFSAAVTLNEEELNALRKREGARISRDFADPWNALEWLTPLATVSDLPVDLRKAVMATPPERIRAAFDKTRSDTAQFSVRRLPARNR